MTTDLTDKMTTSEFVEWLLSEANRLFPDDDDCVYVVKWDDKNEDE